MESHQLTSGPVVVVIGAGLGGILAAIHIKEKLGFDNFLVFEKDSEVGGTWRDNRYPGCRCDISSYFYSLSTDFKYDWNEFCADQPAILAYAKDVVRNHHLEPHILLNTEVVEAEWIETSQAYSVSTRDAKGTRTTLMANVIISATGILHVPRMPNIPGMDTFKGELFHTARWKPGVDLRGKRVAVIGNGSTGAQLMSEIGKLEGIQVTQFFRTRNWILPGVSKPLSTSRNSSSAIDRFLDGGRFGFIVPRERAFLTEILKTHELNYLLIYKFKWMRSRIKKFATDYMHATAPKKYHDILIPDFPVGCRRILYDPGYLKALHRPNVDLRANAIAEIYPEGILTTNGEKLPFDVIICASGFVADKYPIPIRGRNNETVQEYYDRTEGPNAYLGISVPGFPNFHVLAGPNTATGYTSVLFFEETQMEYISKFVVPVLKGTATSFEVTKAANEEYNRDIQAKLKDTVYTYHSSWYRVNFSGRNAAIFPGSGILYWWMCKNIKWGHYRVTGLKGAAVTSLGSRSPFNMFAIKAVVLGLVAVLVAHGFSV